MSKGDSNKEDEAQDGPAGEPVATPLAAELAAGANGAPNAQLAPPASQPQVTLVMIESVLV